MEKFLEYLIVGNNIVSNLPREKDKREWKMGVIFNKYGNGKEVIICTIYWGKIRKM